MHGNIPCEKFRRKQCRFSSENCIFNHELQVFRLLPQNSVPPDEKLETTNIQNYFRTAQKNTPKDGEETKQKITTETLTAQMLELLPSIMKSIIPLIVVQMKQVI